MKAHKLDVSKALPISDPISGQPLDGQFVYADQLKAALGRAGVHGMTTDDVLKAVEIMREINSGKGVLYLTPADFQWVLSRVNTVQWAIASEALAEFIRDIRDAPLVEMEASDN